MTRNLQRWGVWRFRAETKTLEYPDHDPLLDLCECNAESLLEQLFEIANQQWAEPDIVKDAIRAIAYLVDPCAGFRLKDRSAEDVS